MENSAQIKDNNLNKERNEVDTGLACLMIISKFHGLNSDVDQIKHAFAIGKDGMSRLDIIKAAKGIGLKSKFTKIKKLKLEKMKLPAILETKTGKYIIVARKEKDKYLILNPLEQKPNLVEETELYEYWDGLIILAQAKGSQIKEEIFNFKWFLPSILKYKKPLLEVLLAAFTMQIIGLATPIVMQVIIDKVLVHKGLATLDVLTIGLLIVIVFDTILKIARTYVFTHTTNKIDVTLSARLFDHLLKLPLRYFESRRVGDTIARVREVENIRAFLTGTPLSSVLDVMFLSVYLGVMFFYSTTLTWVLLGSMPFFIGLSLIITPIFRHRLDEKFKSGADTHSYLVEAVSGVQTLKSLALEPQCQKKWEDISAKYVKSTFKTSILSGTAGALGQTIQRVSDLLILWIGARLVIDGKISVGQLIAFRMLSSRVSSPILRLVQMWQEFQQAALSVRRLGDIFNSKPEPSLDPSKAKLPQIKGDISFEGVRFRYRVDVAEAVRDVSFNIESGTMVGIVGRSGSGKSTLSKLVQRLYIPESGKIRIDGVDISLADPAWLRRQIGVVLQESFLFNLSIRENIAIHYPAATMEEIVRSSKIAGAHEFILELPEGYDTMVGEKGASLSGGQKQRVAIARALITNPKVLIFDEATSALDYESEKIIQENLNLICKGRTVLIIAHRLSTIRDVNKIMVMEKGELAEFGTHDELIEAKGIYHHLHSQQL